MQAGKDLAHSVHLMNFANRNLINSRYCFVLFMYTTMVYNLLFSAVGWLPSFWIIRGLSNTPKLSQFVKGSL